MDAERVENSNKTERAKRKKDRGRNLAAQLESIDSRAYIVGRLDISQPRLAVASWVVVVVLVVGSQPPMP